ncbi:unnamed protein product [Caenorhabditis brenneri]
MSADSAETKEIFKKMTDKLEQHNNSNNNAPTQWAPFQPSFNGRPSEPHPHPFNYEQQHRVVEPTPNNFNNDTNRQQPAPLMPHFFPRIGLSFPDFNDYNRFNGFQRNFFTNPFTPQFPTPAYPFPINPAMHNPMANMDNFNLPQSIPQQFNQNTNSNTNSNEIKPKEVPVQNTTPQASEEDKPPILSAEYLIKRENKINFNANQSFPTIPKQESIDNSPRKMNGTKKEPDFPTFPPALTAEKPFEPARSRDDLAPYNTPFYPNQQLGMDATNNGFKQEINTPPAGILHDCQVCLSTHANGLHFGARTCAACAAFFRRTISDDKRYVCKRNQRCNNASRDGTGYRKICRSCRMKRCLEIGMLPENVQHKRNRRESNSPHNKIQLDTFFNGFYPAFPSQATTAPADTTQPADPCHS